MRAIRLALIALLATSTVALPSFGLADSASPNLTALPPIPKHIENICTDLQPSLLAIRTVIVHTSGVAADAGMNALGLGTFSAPRHYRVVEDDAINTQKQLDPALDATSDLQVAIDDLPNSDQKSIATDVTKAYDDSLRETQRYTQAALVFERAAWGRAKTKAQSWGWGGYANRRNENDREMSADQARQVLDSESNSVKDVARNLKLPEHHWLKTCGTALVPEDDTRRQASSPDETPNPNGAPSGAATNAVAPTPVASASPSPSASHAP